VQRVISLALFKVQTQRYNN